MGDLARGSDEGEPGGSQGDAARAGSYGPHHSSSLSKPLLIISVVCSAGFGSTNMSMVRDSCKNSQARSCLK
eukprot:2370960-Rhodomonas_salina.1